MSRRLASPKIDFVLRDKPDICPVCNHFIDPKEIHKTPWYTGEYDHPDRMDVAYICPREKCMRMFIGIFHSVSISSGQGNGVNYEFNHAIPNIPIEPTHDAEVAAISENFIKLYKQAAFAEAYELGDIAGVAYRKSLEFLIKDYTIKKHPDKEENIKKSTLANVINNHVEDTNLKLCSNRASWLGNDETHYERRWINKDIDDLKILIRLTENWIVNEILTEKYASEMCR